MSAETWRMTLPCTRDEAARLAGDLPELAELPVPPTLVTSEDAPAGPERWRLDAYFAGKPSRDTLRRVAALVPSARGRELRAKPVAETDWVSLSQAGFEPLIAGRFRVRTPDHIADPTRVDFVIPAGLAFGTGQHATTAGCLIELDRLKRRGKVFRHVLDLGTGTGVLAFAARRLWRGAAIAASDIDPVAIGVVRENARLNRVTGLRLVIAPGLAHRDLIAGAPYDLVIANILAQPLIDMAAAIAASVTSGGTLILAGLLDRQADAVARSYRREGLRLMRASAGDWPVLTLAKRPAAR